MNIPSLPELPLSQLAEQFHQALAQTPLLLEAEPGAGKSTLAPLWVLQAASVNKQQPESSGGKIYLIQPRVLATQALAKRLAGLLGESVGSTVGYQVPYDACVGLATQLVLMTPGVLLQHLLQDPTLDGVACVMVDEIHERSVNQDLAWAFLQEAQILRDDLQLVLMSATPDPALRQAVTNRLFAPGRCFPVSVEYQPAKQGADQRTESIDDHLLRVLRQQQQWQQQTVLVFLPGWREIDACAQAISRNYPTQPIFRLHSQVAAAEQERALDPREGPRVILSTNIAETSLTIADVTLVIDSGLARRADYEQRTGISRLRTARISMASAEQRRGRAGRVQAGHCIRLWSQDQPLAAADLPEIRATDYLPLALRIAHWGSPAGSLPWLEKPNALALDFAQQQLQQMHLMDAAGNVTARGRAVSSLGSHPRIAAFLLLHEVRISRASLLLALALHFDTSAEGTLGDVLEQAATELGRNRQWQQQQRRWLNTLRLEVFEGEVNAQGLAQAFSDRIGFKQTTGKYRLNSGISIDSPLTSPWAVFPLVFPKAKGHSGVGVSVELDEATQRQLSQHQQALEFKSQQWHLRHSWRMGGVVVDEQLVPLSADQAPGYLLAHIRERWQEKGMQVFKWSDDAQHFLARAQIAAKYQLVELPALDDAALYESLDQWLLPFLTASTSLESLPWLEGLKFYVGHEGCHAIAAALPAAINLPSGRRIAVNFNNDGVAQIAAKLQEFFGCEQLQIAHGKVPLQIHLLSPNGSPLAITTNLQTFWQQAYPDVRKDMRGKYPRHPWPENPLEHEATALTKRKLMQQQSNS